MANAWQLLRGSIIVVYFGLVPFSGCTPTAKTVPGEYEFPLGDGLSERIAEEPVVGAEWFRDHKASEFLAHPDTITFPRFQDEYMNDGRFYSMARPYATFAVGFESNDDYDDGVLGRILSGRWKGVIAYDMQSEKLFETLFEYLLSGIDGGEWRLDYTIDRRQHHMLLASPICTLMVALRPGVPAENDYIIEPGALPLSGRLNVGVFYESVAGDGNYEPRVFIAGARSRSHVFVLDVEHGQQLHDTARDLYLRLVELDDQLPKAE